MITLTLTYKVYFFCFVIRDSAILLVMILILKSLLTNVQFLLGIFLCPNSVECSSRYDKVSLPL